VGNLLSANKRKRGIPREKRAPTRFRGVYLSCAGQRANSPGHGSGVEYYRTELAPPPTVVTLLFARSQTRTGTEFLSCDLLRLEHSTFQAEKKNRLRLWESSGGRCFLRPESLYLFEFTEMVVDLVVGRASNKNSTEMVPPPSPLMLTPCGEPRARPCESRGEIYWLLAILTFRLGRAVGPRWLERRGPLGVAWPVIRCVGRWGCCFGGRCGALGMDPRDARVKPALDKGLACVVVVAGSAIAVMMAVMPVRSEAGAAWSTIGWNPIFLIGKRHTPEFRNPSVGATVRECSQHDRGSLCAR